MLQQSKLVKSRDMWNKKAVERAEELREMRKLVKRLKQELAEFKAEKKRTAATARHRGNC